MPWSERAVIVALCGIALVVLVVWVVRSLRSGAAGPQVEPPPQGRASDRLKALYHEYGWDDALDDGGDTSAPDVHAAPPGR
jgi:hypothetical protein